MRFQFFEKILEKLREWIRPLIPSLITNLFLGKLVYEYYKV